MENHITYLSTHDGLWAVIHQGMPLCADTPIRENAEKVAAHFNLKPSAIWNGDSGKFEAIQPDWRRAAYPLSPA